MARVIWIFTIVATLTLAGCSGPASSPSRLPTPPHPLPDTGKRLESSTNRAAIVRTAAGMVGADTIEVNGRQIAYDCAGVTRAIYLAHGIDLYDGTADAKANGVRLIYEHVRRHGQIHQGPRVHPGDLVFFDNTWDYNGDGKMNDVFTHVGVVERLESDGTVVFISRVADSIERFRMNLDLPHVHKTTSGRTLNDYMRRKQLDDNENTGYLTGELFAFFGTRLDR